MRGKPELKIELEKVYKTKKNPNGMFVARILQIPKEEDKLDFVLILQNRKTKNIIYNKILVTTDNDYYSFRLVGILNGPPYILLPYGMDLGIN